MTPAVCVWALAVRVTRTMRVWIASLRSQGRQSGKMGG